MLINCWKLGILVQTLFQQKSINQRTQLNVVQENASTASLLGKLSNISKNQVYLDHWLLHCNVKLLIKRHRSLFIPNKFHRQIPPSIFPNSQYNVDYAGYHSDPSSSVVYVVKLLENLPRCRYRP